MTENWRSDWSRHYDQIQWTATTIFTAAISGLLAYSYSREGATAFGNPSEFQPWLASIGLWLTWVTVYYAASCRELRRQFHESLPCGEEKHLLNKSRKLRQWDVFLATFALFTAAWLWQYWMHGWHCLAVALGVISIWWFVVLRKLGGLGNKEDAAGTAPSGDSPTSESNATSG